MKQAPTLIDRMYRMSFQRDTVFGWRSNPAMRTKLEQARRFVLDDRMSGFLGQLTSVAFARLWEGKDPAGVRKLVPQAAALTDQLRVSARLPHKLTWIEFNLRECLSQVSNIFKEKVPSGRVGFAEPFHADEAPKYEGWLLEQHPQLDYAFSVYLFNAIDETELDSNGNSMWTFPIAFGWTVTDDPLPWSAHVKGARREGLHEEYYASELFSGIEGYQTDKLGAIWPELLIPPQFYGEQNMAQLMEEFRGCVRRIWALLATLNDIPVMKTEVKQSRGFLGQHRIRKFLDHSVITLHVPQQLDTRKLARQLVTIARKRAHQVRGHWRVDWRNPPSSRCPQFQATGLHAWGEDGTVCQHCRGHRIWIDEHQRGDASLGFVTHDYRLEHEAQS